MIRTSTVTGDDPLSEEEVAKLLCSSSLIELEDFGDWLRPRLNATDRTCPGCQSVTSTVRPTIHTEIILFCLCLANKVRSATIGGPLLAVPI